MPGVEEAFDTLTPRVQRILGLIAEGRNILRVPDASERRALALTRWEMLRALHELVTFKRVQILDPIIARGEPRRAERAKALRCENEALQLAYDGFVHRWTLKNPVVVDDLYRDEALKISTRIEREVISDVQELERLIG